MKIGKNSYITIVKGSRIDVWNPIKKIIESFTTMRNIEVKIDCDLPVHPGLPNCNALIDKQDIDF